jgi:hypothetical protein
MIEPTADQTATTPSSVSASPAQPNGGAPELTTEQTTMMGWLKDDHAKGRMSDTELATALQELTGEDLQQSAPDTRTPEQLQHDSQFPPAKPEHYTLPQYDDPEHITPAMTAFDATARGWLATGLFPKEHGSAIAKEANRVAAQLEHYTEGQHELFRRTEMATLSKIWGADTAKNLAMARAFIREVGEKSPQLIEMLDRTGIGNSASIVIQCFHQAERLHARNGGK